MKSVVFSACAAALFLATGAQAGIDSGLSRGIEAKVDSAHAKAATAQAAFDAGDANGGCRALVGAARDLDRSIDMSISLIDGATGSRSIEENGDNYMLVLNMRNRLKAIVDERGFVQQQLEDRCRTVV